MVQYVICITVYLYFYAYETFIFFPSWWLHLASCVGEPFTKSMNILWGLHNEGLCSPNQFPKRLSLAREWPKDIQSRNAWHSWHHTNLNERECLGRPHKSPPLDHWDDLTMMVGFSIKVFSPTKWSWRIWWHYITLVFLQSSQSHMNFAEAFFLKFQSFAVIRDGHPGWELSRGCISKLSDGLSELFGSFWQIHVRNGINLYVVSGIYILI